MGEKMTILPAHILFCRRKTAAVNFKYRLAEKGSLVCCPRT